jgi:predicted DNA-binding protein
MTVTEKEITVRLSLVPYHRLQELARQAGRTPESLTREIVERVLEESAAAAPATPQTARQILEATGRVRSLSPSLRQKIIPGVTLEDVRTALDRAGGPSLSEIILRQRERRS